MFWNFRRPGMVWRLLTAALALITFALSAHAESVTAFAAASLRNAMDEVGAQYQRRHGEKVVISYASSSALAKQIENGAPADVFISADLEWMNYLERRGFLRAGSRINLLRNEIVLIAPQSSAVSLTPAPRFPLASQLGNGRLAIADPDHVPAGKYAKAALETLGVWPSVADKLARGENVRAALNYVSRGEAPLGIVYRTDAAADRNVRVLGTFPSDSHPPIVYPAALVTGAKNPLAGNFFRFLRSTEAAAVFKKHGFVPY